MTQSIGAFTLLVPEYDEGLSFFRDTLGFAVIEDRRLGERQTMGRRRAGGRRRRAHRARHRRAMTGNGRVSAIRPAGGSAIFFKRTTSTGTITR